MRLAPDQQIPRVIIVTGSGGRRPAASTRDDAGGGDRGGGCLDVPLEEYDLGEGLH